MGGLTHRSKRDCLLLAVDVTLFQPGGSPGHHFPSSLPGKAGRRVMPADAVVHFEERTCDFRSG